MRLSPVPTLSADGLGAWAIKIIAFLKSLVREIETPGPKIIQLEHLIAGSSATSDGLIAYEPVTGTIVVSKDGAWYPVQLGPAIAPTSGVIKKPRMQT